MSTIPDYSKCKADVEASFKNGTYREGKHYYYVLEDVALLIGCGTEEEELFTNFCLQLFNPRAVLTSRMLENSDIPVGHNKTYLHIMTPKQLAKALYCWRSMQM